MGEKIKDGLVVFYVKDGKLLPIAMNEEELQLINVMIGGILGTVKVINKPLGKAFNLLDEKQEDDYAHRRDDKK